MFKFICFTLIALAAFSSSHAAQCKLNFTNHGNFEYHGQGATEQQARENALEACYRIQFGEKWRCDAGYIECSSTGDVYCSPNGRLHRECGSCHDDGATSSKQCWMADSCRNFQYLVSSESPCRGG